MIDIFFIDNKVQTEDGITLPACWTHTVNDGLDEEGNPINERIEALSAWQGLFCPPVIGNTEDGKHVFHLMGTTQQADLLEAADVLLARSYYGFQAIHPLIAARCTEVEYELNGEQSRCKVADLPAGAKVLAVRAPSKYLGVESPTTPDPPEEKLFPTQIREISQADAGMILMKDTVKPAAMAWIKAHPDCTDYDLVAWIGAQHGEHYAGATMAMLAIYIQGAFQKGLIQEMTFEAFRDFVVETPVEQLEAF